MEGFALRKLGWCCVLEIHSECSSSIAPPGLRDTLGSPTPDLRPGLHAFAPPGLECVTNVWDATSAASLPGTR